MMRADTLPARPDVMKAFVMEMLAGNRCDWEIADACGMTVKEVSVVRAQRIRKQNERYARRLLGVGAAPVAV